MGGGKSKMYLKILGVLMGLGWTSLTLYVSFDGFRLIHYSLESICEATNEFLYM